MAYQSTSFNLSRYAQGRARGWQVPPVAPWPVTEQALRGPIVVNEQTLEALPVAGRCIDLLSSLVAGLPVYGKAKDDPPPRLLKPARQAEMEWPTYTTIQATIRALLIWGNAYWVVVERYANGDPYSVYQLNPCWVSLSRGNDTGILEYWYGAERFDQAEVIHFRGSGYPGFAAASPPVNTLLRLWQIATAEAQMAKEWATRGGQPIGYLTAPIETMSQAELLRQSEAFADYFDARVPQVPLLGRGVEYKGISFSAKEMELVATRQWSATEICTAFGVPPHLVGVPAVESSTTYSSALMDMNTFVKLTLGRWVNVLEASLRPELGVFNFDLDALLRANMTERYAAYEVALRSGWMTVDEVREKENLPPMAKGENDGLGMADMDTDGAGMVDMSGESIQTMNPAGRESVLRQAAKMNGANR